MSCRNCGASFHSDCVGLPASRVVSPALPSPNGPNRQLGRVRFGLLSSQCAVVIPLCGYGLYPLPRVRCACTQPRLPFPKRHGSFRGNAGADSSPALGSHSAGEGEVESMRSVQRPRPAAPDRTAGLGASCCCVTCRSAPHNNMYTTCRCPGLAANSSSPSSRAPASGGRLPVTTQSGVSVLAAHVGGSFPAPA